MTKRKHGDKRWQALRKRVLPRLRAMLPMPCPRCGTIMTADMRLDLGHLSRHPELAYSDQNVRLEHMSCNRRDGQRITQGMMKARRASKKEQMPSW